MNYKENIKRFDEFNARIIDFVTQNNKDLKYESNKLREYATALFERFAPFKAGDRVVLTKTPKIMLLILSSSNPNKLVCASPLLIILSTHNSPVSCIFAEFVESSMYVMITLRSHLSRVAYVLFRT